MATMSTRRHLRELQWRLLLIAVFFVTGGVLAYSFRDAIIPLLMAPLHGERLIYLNPAGGFSFIFLVAVYAGIALAFPVLLHQLYSFLRPALPSMAQKKSSRIVLASFVLLISGIAFGYFVAVPNALAFLYSFADAYVDASLTADSYLSFIVAYTVGVGIVFQVPLLLILIHAVKPLTPGGLMKSEKWVVLVAFIVAAIITPTPDPINQTIIAVPVIAVYQLGVAAVLWSIYKVRRQQKRTAKRQALIDSLAIAQPTPTIPVATVQPALVSQRTVSTRPLTAPMRSMDGVRRVQSSQLAQGAPARPLAVSTPPHHVHLQKNRVSTQHAQSNQRFAMDGVRPIRRAVSF